MVMQPELADFAVYGVGGIVVLLAVAKIILYFITSPFNRDARRPRKPYLTDLEAKKTILRQEFSMDKVPSNPDAIVIGSGVGGLSCSTILSKAGKKVLVLDQRDIAGGCMAPLDVEKEGYCFDYGVHYVGQMAGSGPAKFYFDQLTEGQIEWAPMEAAYDKVCVGMHSATARAESPRWYSIFKDAHKNWKPVLKRDFPDEHEAIDEYFRMLKDNWYCCWVVMASKHLPLWLNWLIIKTGLINLMVPMWRKKYQKSTYELLQGLTDNADLRAIFCHMYFVMCTSPRSLTMPMLAGCVFHYNTVGEFYPTGGFVEIPRCMVDIIERAGGRVLVKADVKEILFEGTRAVGVRVSSSSGTHELRAPVVISGAGLHNTFRKLIPRQIATKSFMYKVQEKIKPSRGLLLANLGFNRSGAELGLKGETIWAYDKGDLGLAADRWYEGTLAEALNTEDIPDIGVCFTSPKDPAWDCVPACRGKSTCCLFVWANYEWFKKFENGQNAAEYEAAKANISEKLQRAFFKMYPHLRAHLDYVKVETPLDAVNYTRAYNGGGYGNCFGRETYGDLWDVTRIRPDTGLKGLYIVGQDILTAGLLPTATSGAVTANAILGRAMIFDLTLLDWAIYLKELVTGKKTFDDENGNVVMGGEEKRKALEMANNNVLDEAAALRLRTR